MRLHTYKLPYNHQIPLLDNGFDRMDSDSPVVEDERARHIFLCYDRAWDDQLDEGKEMSLPC